MCGFLWCLSKLASCTLFSKLGFVIYIPSWCFEFVLFGVLGVAAGARYLCIVASSFICIDDFGDMVVRFMVSA